MHAAWRLVAVAATLVVASPGVPLPGLFALDRGNVLNRVDVRTGTMVPVGAGQPVQNVGLAQQVSAVDPVRQTYYVLGFNLSDFTPAGCILVGVSLATGEVISQAPVDAFATDHLIGLGQNIAAYEPGATVLAASGIAADGRHVYGTADPVSGAFTLRATAGCIAPACEPVMAGAAAYAPAPAALYLAQLRFNGSTVHLVAANLSSGEAQILPDCGELETLAFCASERAFYGIGLRNSKSQRVLVRLALGDSGPPTCKVIGDIDGYYMIGAGMSALDEGAGVLYWLAAPGGFPVNYTISAYHIVGTRLADATTVSDARFCCFSQCELAPPLPTCPWSIEFFSP